MIRSRGWSVVLLLAVLSCFAIACGVFVAVAESNQAIAVAAGICALALVQLFLLVSGWIKFGNIRAQLKSIILEKRVTDDKFRQTFVPADFFDQEITALKLRAEQTDKDIQLAIAASRAEFHDVLRRYDTMTTAPGQQIHSEPPAFSESQQPAQPLEQLNFLLEPVIDLSTNQTAHYRARFSMTVVDGDEIDFSKLVTNADRSGLRPSLDSLVVSQAVPLLRRLRIKHPAMRLLLPIGVATLMSAASLAAIANSFADAADVADGIVFELTHDVLGKLNEAGITGLATIARMGATMAVTNASVAGLDLSALRQLGVLFIGIDAQSIESGYGVDPSWQAFFQVARGLQLQILLTDVTTSTQAASSAQIARYVSGPFFAPPRRVKSNVGVAGANDLSVAA